MTEIELRNKVVSTAAAWLGCKESDCSHRKIIDLYNSHKPRARGYKVKYTDPWCATTVSAVSIACGLTDIFPTECGCGKLIDLFKDLGAWVEADDYIPKPADVCFYDWGDSGKGDNTGYPDHVGLVEKVEGGNIIVIEGNYSNSVKRRTLEINGRYIRGFAVPDYASKADEMPAAPAEPAAPSEPETPKPTNTATYCTVKLPQLKKGDTGDTVKALQILLIGRGYSCGKYGTDGDFGSDTDKAVKTFQKAKDLTADGVVGPMTWAKLLGV